MRGLVGHIHANNYRGTVSFPLKLLDRQRTLFKVADTQNSQDPKAA